jgi:hypothetical protein
VDKLADIRNERAAVLSTKALNGKCMSIIALESRRINQVDERSSAVCSCLAAADAIPSTRTLHAAFVFVALLFSAALLRTRINPVREKLLLLFRSVTVSP